MIIAFDPGYTTGAVILSNFRRLPAPTLLMFDVMVAFNIYWQDRLRVIDLLIANHGNKCTAIVFERYKLFAHADAIAGQIGSEIPSARVIGTLESVCERYNVLHKLVAQETWARKQIAVAPAHASLIMQSPHTQDAYGHAVYFARNNVDRLC